MDSKTTIPDKEIQKTLNELHFTQSVDEGRLMLVELMVKANAGYRNSHTEEGFLRSFGLLKADRTANKKGRRFLCAMHYMHSEKRAELYYLMDRFRK